MKRDRTRPMMNIPMVLIKNATVGSAKVQSAMYLALQVSGR